MGTNFEVRPRDERSFFYGEKGFGVFRKVLMVGSCGNHWSVTSLSSVDKTNETLKSSYKDSEDIFFRKWYGCRISLRENWLPAEGINILVKKLDGDTVGS
jgi:hypothetical protein